MVTDSIRRFLAATTELEARVRAVWENQTASEKRALERQSTTVRQELSRVQMLYDGLYQNLVGGLISRPEYLTMKERYQSLCEEKEICMAQLHQQQANLERFSPENPMFVALREFQGAESLSVELIHTLIARIEYGSGDDLRVILAYQDEFSELLRFAKEVGCA